MVKFLFIRHGKTRSNTERRYPYPRFDEPLCPQGEREASVLAESGALPKVDAVVTGAAARCVQTARLLFPGMQYDLCGMREIDFGIFSGKNADDLVGCKDYAGWLDTRCMGDIPGGGSVDGFRERCAADFALIASARTEGVTALVLHGGNIMAILERFASPPRDFYDFRLPNCGFLLCRYENGALCVEERG